MKIIFETMENHDTDAEGDPLSEHCCGCWNICLSQSDPLTPYAVCNECNERRTFRAVGIRSPHDELRRLARPGLRVVPTKDQP